MHACRRLATQLHGAEVSDCDGFFVDVRSPSQLAILQLADSRLRYGEVLCISFN